MKQINLMCSLQQRKGNFITFTLHVKTWYGFTSNENVTDSEMETVWLIQEKQQYEKM